MRYQVVVRGMAQGSWKWGKRSYVAIVDTTLQSPHTPIRRGIIRYWPHLDARYDGPRSQFGRAIREAETLARAMNAEELCVSN